MNYKIPESGKSIAWFLLAVFSINLLSPVVAFAGEGGPSQPEVQGFTPSGTSDLVDPFTGDFSYNIPLMDVEGYPITMGYNAEVTMDQEASWVGLGWSLNMGAVVRNLRGLPDDFNGETVSHTTYMKPNRTFSVNAGAGFELFGKEPKLTLGDDPVNLSVGLGISHNNYNGFGAQVSLGPSLEFAKTSGHSLTAGFQLSGSSENGASFSPSLSFEKKVKDACDDEISKTKTIGSALNSRAGLSYISYSASMSKQYRQYNSKTEKFEDQLASGSSGGSFDLGLNSYSPTTSPSMLSASLQGSVKVSGTAFGVDGSFDLGISYSSQWIPKDKVTVATPSYGYFFLENGQKKEKGQLDFNRDNDGAFTKYTPYLPSAFLTYDIFSVQAQGTGGSFRGFRNEVGYVFDPKVSTTSGSGSFGLELGFGNLTDVGVDVSVNAVTSHTGGWNGGLNRAKNKIQFEPASIGLETYAMQNAGERGVENDPLMSNLGGTTPNYFPLSGGLKFVTLDDKLKGSSGTLSVGGNNRESRLKRNEVLHFLSHQDMQNNFGVNAIHPDIYSNAKPYHIGQITQLGTDGRRYVFGIAAYNHFQEEITFATGKKLNGSSGLSVSDDYSGLINYGSYGPSQLLSPNNDYGVDNFYSSSVTPGYAHSFLLTSVLSDDYADSDDEKGPSPDDMGSYVKFSYEKIDEYKWRTPMEENMAFRNEGMKTDLTDDKASIVYGQKDLWYVVGVETKNYIAVFELEDREDGAGVNGKHGGLDGTKRMKSLKSITLYSRPDYEANGSSATPIKKVNFTYDYSLCEGYPGNTGGGDGTGKLTLKSVSFSYQNSGRMLQSSYTFEYQDHDPDYNMKAVDRWGSYKPTSSGMESSLTTPMNNADFPYAEQDRTDADAQAAPWSLVAINLPSGGRIEIDYEADDYAYVQHLEAMQMFPIVGTTVSVNGGTNDGASVSADLNFDDYQSVTVSSSENKNQSIYFKMKPGHTDISKYVKVGQMLYFRCLMDFREGESGGSTTKYEYVSGYGRVGSVGTETHNGVLLGRIDFVGERLKDSGGSDYNPISKFGIQFGRMRLSRYIFDSPIGNTDASADETSLKSMANAIVSSLGSFEELFDGPNLPIWENQRGRKIVLNKSWIRLVEPTKHKIGGGHRVKEVRMYDKWDQMTGDGGAGFYYGQHYSYNLPDGTSSGVASYEPQIGGDENPWHDPVPYSNKIRWGTDDKLYYEQPLMESQFPTPSVGYSRVEIRDLERGNVKRTATGKVVKEFYTSKDFPTIVKATDIDLKTANSFLPVVPKYQYLSASQGFSIELNDMHGKPRKESVYSQGNNDSPLSTVEYFYQQTALNLNGRNNYKLNNQVKTVDSKGTQSTSEIGVKYEAVADFRESTTLSTGGSADFNTNSFLFGFLPIVVPMVWPSVDISDNQFHSATMNKIVNRFGILEKTVANQDGSIVETRNLAYDAETGEVLTTETSTNFNDKVYSMSYPAYWLYDEMGQAYKNIGVRFATNIDFSSSGFATISSANKYFVPGDELAVTAAATAVTGWVKEVTPTGIFVIDKTGNPITTQDAALKVIRSGRRNKQITTMASLTGLTNPLNGISGNSYTNVLNAGAVEFGQNWKTYCNCFEDEEGAPLTTNPYIMGTKGNWRPVRSYTHLSGRTQSDFDNNTNIRKDGVFTSYSPFYRLQNQKWVKNPLNWTYVSEVTAFSPNGMTLETRDALGRYSASLFGYNNTLTTAVAANSSMKQTTFLSFEDVDYTNCADTPLNLQTDEEEAVPAEIYTRDAHTGRNSMRVSSGTPVVFTAGADECPDEVPCSLEIDMDGEDQFTYIISGGTAPYTLDYNMSSGMGELDLEGNVITVTLAAKTLRVVVTITDANGCTHTETIFITIT